MNPHLQGIKLISFDIWLTLIRSHPEYKKQRAALLREILVIDSISADDFLITISQIDRDFDRLSDQTGRQYGLPDRVRAIHQNAQAKSTGLPVLKDSAIEKFDKASGELILQYLPQLLEVDLAETFSQLKNLGLQLAVISNTGFIDGRHMRPVLKKLGLLPQLSFQVFSNEVGAAKPDRRVFQWLVQQSGISAQEVLHIGDNPQTDYHGASAAGCQALLLSTQIHPDLVTIPSIASLIR